MDYKRYIDAVGLAEVIENLDIRVAGKPARWNDAKYSVLREISQAPDADVEEVKHGEWKRQKNGFYFLCSVCGKAAATKGNYCHSCGTKMDGGKAE